MHRNPAFDEVAENHTGNVVAIKALVLDDSFLYLVIGGDFVGEADYHLVLFIRSENLYRNAVIYYVRFIHCPVLLRLLACEISDGIFENRLFHIRCDVLEQIVLVTL